MFETRVRRTLYPLVDNAHAIALTVDQGTIDTGARSQSLCEILLTGREDARMDAAMTAATEAYADLAKVKPFWR